MHMQADGGTSKKSTCYYQFFALIIHPEKITRFEPLGDGNVNQSIKILFSLLLINRVNTYHVGGGNVSWGLRVSPILNFFINIATWVLYKNH